MGSAERQSAAFGISVVIHGSALLWGAFSVGPGFELPELDIEFTEVEFLDPNALQGNTKEVPPEPVVAPPQGADDAKASAGEDGPGPDEAEAEPEEQPKPLGRRSSKVDQLAPSNSTFSMLLATKKVRPLPFASKGVDIMSPLPDFQFIIQGGGFDVLHDFDYVIVASPDVRDVTQTFLAVHSNLPRAELRAGIERSIERENQSIEWIERDGLQMGNPRPTDSERPDVDPRWFVFLDDDVAIYVREEFLPNVTEGPQSTDVKTSGNFVANLAKIRRFAGREPRAGMQLVMKDLHAALKRPPKGLPFAFPDAVEVMSEAAEDPELVIKLKFVTPADARGALEFWQESLTKMIDDDLRLKLTAKWLYDLIEAERKNKQLVLRGRFSTAQAEQVLELLAGFAHKMLRKSSEERERARLEREENWKRRQGGKLPPSALAESEETGPEPATGTPPRQPANDTESPGEPPPSRTPAPAPAPTKAPESKPPAPQ